MYQKNRPLSKNVYLLLTRTQIPALKNPMFQKGPPFQNIFFYGQISGKRRLKNLFRVVQRIKRFPRFRYFITTAGKT